MSRDTLSVKRFPVSLLAIALACLLPLACTSSEDAAGPDDGQGPGDGPGGPNPTVTASFVISDVSPPAAMSGVDAINGEVSFSGLTVEISEDGENWLTVTDGPTTATVALGDGAAEATLVPATEIPAGDYTMARLTAMETVVDLSVTIWDGRDISAQFRPPGDRPLVTETDLEVTINEDGSRTFRIELETIRTLTLDGTEIAITGDLGTIGATANMRANVVAIDVSRPNVDVSGTVTFSGLTIELWDDGTQEWLLVTDQPTTVEIAIGDGTAQATLMEFTDIPNGTYSQTRLTATEALVDITAMVGGRELSAQISTPPGESVVIVKDVEVTINEDGSSTFKIELETVQFVNLETLGQLLVIVGDLGVLSAGANMSATLVGSDVSEPAGANISGNVVFTGLTIELSADGETWLTVAENEGEATVTLGDGAAEATLMPVDDIPARSSDDPYTRVRFTASDALLELTADMNGESVQVSIADIGPVVIEKDVTVVDNGDGTRTFRVELECVRTIDLRTDPASGATIVIVDGDLGVGQAPVS